MTGENRPRGATVAVTADRRRDEQAVLLERLGLEVLMFPLLRTEAEDTGPLRALSEQLCRQPPDYFVANTGYGMRTWLQLSAQWGLQEALVQALSTGTTIAARGAKALGEMRKVGLDAWYKAPGETLDEVVARLCQEDLHDASVMVQLHGEPPGAWLGRLEGSGARVTYLPVYRMADGGAQAADDLISALLGHAVDAVTFTAAPQNPGAGRGGGGQRRNGGVGGRLQHRRRGGSLHRPGVRGGGRSRRYRATSGPRTPSPGFVVDHAGRPPGRPAAPSRLTAVPAGPGDGAAQPGSPFRRSPWRRPGSWE